jgi:hypothetical protein
MLERWPLHQATDNMTDCSHHSNKVENRRRLTIGNLIISNHISVGKDIPISRIFLSSIHWKEVTRFNTHSEMAIYQKGWQSHSK